MENEKLKKEERERMEQDRLDKKRVKEELEREAEEEMMRQRQLEGRTSPIMPRKSRFVRYFDLFFVAVRLKIIEFLASWLICFLG